MSNGHTLADILLRPLNDEVEEIRKRHAWSKTSPTTLAHGLAGDYRIDQRGNVIRWSEYGQRTQFGWHIDHFPIPKALGGTDHPSNLRALHWRDNCSHGGSLGSRLREMI